MEVWAHGQDIHDLLGIARINHDRIRTICDLGVRTQDFPSQRTVWMLMPPAVILTTPGGDTWTWNEGGA